MNSAARLDRSVRCFVESRLLVNLPMLITSEFCTDDVARPEAHTELDGTPFTNALDAV